MKLFELAEDYLKFLDAVENGEIPEEAIEDTLEAIEASFVEKVDNIACMIKSIDAECAAIRSEEIKMAERRKAKERNADRIRNYLAATVQRIGIDKVETARNRISFRKSETVEISEDFLLWAVSNRPDLVVIGDPKADKQAIKAAIKCGEEVVGAEIRVNTNLQLK